MSWPRIVFALVLREWREWWPVVAAAPLLGLLPLLVPRLDQVADAVATHGESAVRQGVAAALIAVVGLALVGSLAAGLLVRDLAERRAGFYFSRPIPAAALWIGKLVAGSTLVPAVIVGLALPMLLADPPTLDLVGEPDRPARALSAMHDAFVIWDAENHPKVLPAPLWWLGGFAAIVLVLAIGHGFATAMRSRDPWALLDLLGLGAVGAMLVLARDGLLAAQAHGPLVLVERFFFVAVLFAVVGAGLVQLAIGRVDLRRGHAAFSATLWGSLSIVAIGLWSYAAWAASPTFDDLVTVDSTAVDPEGRWWLATGSLRHRPGQIGSFLVDLDASEPRRAAEHIGGPLPYGRWAMSADGSRLVWLRCARVAIANCTVWTRDLRAGTPARATSIELSTIRVRLLLSPFGDRLATVTHDRVAVHLMPTGEVLGAARSDWLEPLAFVGPDTLRYMKGTEEYTSIVELGPDPKGFDRPWVTRVTGRLPNKPDGLWTFHPEADRLFLSRITPLHHSLRDARTGDLLLDLTPLVGDDRIVSSTFLDDARAVLAVTEAMPDLTAPAVQTYSLLIVDPTTDAPRSILLPATRSVRFGAEVEPGRLLVGLVGESLSTVVVDVDTGTVEPWVDGLLPLRVVHSPGSAKPKPGSRAAELFVDGGRALFRVDPRSEPIQLAGPFVERF